MKQTNEADFFMQLPVPSEEIDPSTEDGLMRYLEITLDDDVERAQVTFERPLAEYNGKKGFWITKGGRKIFITKKDPPAGFWKSYVKFTGEMAMWGAVIGGLAGAGLYGLHTAAGHRPAMPAVAAVGGTALGMAIDAATLVPRLAAHALVGLIKGGGRALGKISSVVGNILKKTKKPIVKIISATASVRAFGDPHKTYWMMPDMDSIEDLDAAIKTVKGFTDGVVCFKLSTGGELEIPKDMLIKGLGTLKEGINQYDAVETAATKQELTGL